MGTTARRVVITGLGVVSPIGTGREAFWNGLMAGRSAAAPIQSFVLRRLPCRFGAEVRDFDARRHIKNRKSLKVMARDIQLAVAAAQLAMDDARLEPGAGDPTRFGVSFGAGMICSDLDELGPSVAVSQTDGRFDLRKWGQEGLEQLFPLWLLKYLPNMLACHISIIHDAQGPNNTITNGDAAGHMAIGEAARVIARGSADVVIAGGAESKINPLVMVRLCLLHLLSGRNDAPEKACRPFDRDRDGMVAGEAAGAVILEELEHARRRGATIYAELAGFGAAAGAGDPWQMDGAEEGIEAAMRLALEDGRLSPDEVGLVMANGVSTREADAAEARAIGRVFGPPDRQPPVTAPKSLYGNLGAGNGAVDLIAACLALRHGQIPATANFETPDPGCAVNVVHGRPRPLERPAVMTQAFTQAGQVACLVARSCKDALSDG